MRSAVRPSGDPVVTQLISLPHTQDYHSEHQAHPRDAIGKSSGGGRLLYSSWAAEAVGADKRLANSNVRILDSNGRMVLQGAAGNAERVQGGG